MNRDKEQERAEHVERLLAQHEGNKAGLSWLINEQYYYSEIDLMICEHCGAEFYVPPGDYARPNIGDPSSRTKYQCGGWAGRRGGGKHGADLCHACTQVIMKKVKEMEAAEKEAVGS